MLIDGGKERRLFWSATYFLLQNQRVPLLKRLELLTVFPMWKKTERASLAPSDSKNRLIFQRLQQNFPGSFPFAAAVLRVVFQIFE